MTTESTTTSSEARTAHGPVRGTHADGVHRFLGVPYAAPPFGPRRFAPPQPPQPWSEPRDATTYGATAPKPPYRATVAELLPEPTVPGEDCLHVNVWSPDLDGSAPVLVWVHGGSFQNGSNAVPVYDGTAFARDGVVCVTVNYRLGVDGFGHFPDAPDNRGSLDQIAALEWVRDNIAAFGGDPTRVTICGESAGAFGITTLTAMPAARGLFGRVIAQSGAGHHVLHPASAQKITAALAQRLGVEPTAAAFADVPLDRLLAEHDDLVLEVGKDPDPAKWGEVAANLMLFEPVVDGDSLPGVPYDVIARGEGADVDLLIGTTDEEHGLFLHPVLDQLGETRVRATMTAFGAVDGAYEHYAATVVGPTGQSRPGDVLVAAMTDWFFRLPAIRLVEARESLGKPSYVYQFGWRTPVLGGVLGACHALEIPFVFDTLDVPEAQWLGGADAPQALADDMHAAWVAFVRDGDPGWAPYGPARRVRRFGGPGDGTVVDDPDRERREAWPHR
ncbi:carboxylesterase/lipase family protein [Lapillicoccus jejuensis]|uniref:Carboxylic ester hydrolase n=1 Tax=Lapillicoccus jejuensis TaxID=402171 RepID=A0A542DYH2_9MICO|nr:carboxylesterase family protein [Lapillicoccus jejuensis]TQJ08128.1 para-nitrobenzyl esterase [Lapillicoccus jejuensis]